MDTGAFLAPVSGLYSFSFSARSAIDHNIVAIGVYKNDEVQFWIGDENANGQKNYDNISYSWLMSLDQKDKIHLKMWEKSARLYVDTGNFVWFNGQLLKSQ